MRRLAALAAMVATAAAVSVCTAAGKAENYRIDLKAEKRETGQAVVIDIEATNGYKMNLEAPFKIDLSVKSGKATLGKEKVRWEDIPEAGRGRPHLEIPVSLKPGVDRAEIDLAFWFIVCTDKLCTIVNPRQTVPIVR